MVDDAEMEGSANPNRTAEGALGGDWASGIDAAIGNLSLDGRGAGGPVDAHPEKRMKAVSGGVLTEGRREGGGGWG